MGNRWGIQSKFFIIPVIASILILGGFGLSQDAFAPHSPSPPPSGSPTIQITVDTIDGDGSFDFIIFNATNRGDLVVVNIPDTATNDSTPPLPVPVGNFGSYSVEENVPSLNWTIISSDCLINGVSHGSPLKFNIENGDTVVCTFVNLFVPPPEPTCTLPSIDNAPRNQCADIGIDDICEFSCDAGFEPVPPTLTCQDDGEFDASPVCEAITDNQCDGKDATIFKKFPGDDTSNTFVVDGVDVEMVRWDKDKNTTIEANEGWIIKGTGNKKVPLDDVVVGTEKDDKITPGWGDDIVCARAGDDLVQGGWGDDRLFGEDGDDLLKGGRDNDFLVGGADTDEAQGGKGTDTCTAETKSSCEA